ncbi:phosphopantetheine-binding protein [Paenibacillus rhizoplanae]
MNDNKFLAEFVKKAWISGLTIDFAKYYEEEILFRTPLPTYPFERKRHWIEAGKQKAYEAAGSNDWDRELSADSAVEADAIEYNRPDLSVEYEQPDNAIEESIVEILQDIMGITPIGINDNFFELGGHSLMITQVVLRIKELYGIELQLKLFIEAPTVKNVADLVLEELSESLDLDAV